MVKRREPTDINLSSVNIAIDKMGVKVALRVDDDAVLPERGVENSVTNGSAVNVQSSNKKSVLDDIMGDPDDFGDLDAPSDDDGGRWEDTLKAEMEGDATDTQSKLQKKESKVIQKASVDGILKENVSTFGSSLTDCKAEPDALESRNLRNRKFVRQQRNGSRRSGTMVSCDPSPEKSVQFPTRYFIIKSLSHHNIQMSIQRGIWATQVMNEPILEEAFNNSGRVILIFSVNMSGFFQGYAQMMSPVGWKRASVWSESNNGNNPWGRTFQVKWICLYNLPFQKTVHLKNPLNEYKPVKISRDCQELTPEIGEALCALMNAGAVVEESLKRKMIASEPSFAKRIQTDYSSTAPARIVSGGFPTSQVNWSAIPIVHPPIQQIHVKPPAHLEESKPVMSTLSEKMKGRLKGKPGGNSKRDSDTVAEEDLIHMSYEEYVQRASNHTNEYGYPLASVRWPAPVADQSHDEQYMSYLASWYQNQGAAIANNTFYGGPQMVTGFPSAHHP